MVISDRDIWASANLLIQQHGENAAIEAAMKCDAFGERGDRAGQLTWLNILFAIRWLQDTRGRDPFKVEH